VSYLNSPGKGFPRGMKICVWTHLGLMQGKTISKKMEMTSKKMKMEDDLKKNEMEDNIKKNTFLDSS
jgi:hypothetical protein